MANGLDVREVLARLVGCRIVAIEQGFYVFEGAIDRSQCILQVQLDADLTVHLWGSGDGETLAVITAPWNDPFLSR